MAKASTRLYVLQRNSTLASTQGHRIVFRKGVPVEIPTELEHEALAIGATPVEGEPPMKADPAENPAVNTGPADPAERKKEILAAFVSLVAANQRKDFAASGRPKVDAVERVLGYDVDAKELDARWADYNLAKLEEENE